MTRIRATWDYLRGTYWAVPSAMAAIAVGLSVGVIQLDRALAATLVERLSWVYTGGPEGARAVLSTIAASMITVAGVTFSITIVALTLASQQFGPRLLRNFLRDVGNQVVLGTFVSTFIYCLLVLRTVRGSSGTEFVPHLAVTVGVALALLSVGVLIFFIHHVATSIQASQIIARVSEDLLRAIDRLFPERIGRSVQEDGSAAGVRDAQAALAGRVRRVCATKEGYVQGIDADAIMGLARRTGAVVHLQVRPGTFIRAGRVLLTAEAPAGADWEDARFERVFILGSDRTGTQDVRFYINQLVEVAVRALSPGINDPDTAQLCIDRLEQALCRLGARRMPDPRRRDPDGTVRVVAQPVTFAEVVESAFDEIRRYGRASASVTVRLLDAAGNVGSCVRCDADRMALLRQAEMIAEPTAAPRWSPADAAHIADRFRHAAGVLRNADPAQ